MARLDVNRFGEMEVFVKVVELGGFSAAARAFRMTPSAVSKLVARLEQRLGARLVNRSTRALQLTPEGCGFYERSVRILAELEEAERGASTSDEPRGRLRVNTNAAFGRVLLIPLLPGFLARHPGVSVELVLTDQLIDLLDERTDVAIRHGQLKSSQLTSRRLGETRMVIVASPDYVKRHGLPRSPEELGAHNRLGFSYARAIEGWPLEEKDTQLAVPPIGNVQASDGEALRQLALAGVGLARLARFQVQDDLDKGHLVPVLEEHNPGDTEAIHVLFMSQGGHLPSRVRAFVDHLTAHVRIP
ncbi:transcriptional regulator, LysR family [Myxococcus fulvus]|uniref:Transcriptional regulator n=1 Tax=Myxococcus fulvus TaxID=33 RepID=A0A511T9G1_MYXFU|nr:LysR family transcriptional regulator [Myxococcus fulvus]AKF80654.1 LysR family transcriptional regulator [Myxococcus fulvus 124B02]GEN10112.1 transcriptional regulator [Myxococcus fulvus]SEU35467.1 transcriptional regulator, LysR family [Myxococcus fulvus]